MAGFKILICEDEEDFLDWAQEHLEEDGYECITATNGEDVLKMPLDKIGSIALFVIDILLPGITGIKVAIELRETTSAPILFLTAQNEDPYVNQWTSFENCQYVVKSEKLTSKMLRAHVRSLLNGVYQIGKYTLNDDLQDVLVDGKRACLTKTEYEIFRTLAFHRDEYLNANNIIEKIDASKPACDDRDEGIVKTHINNLRKKLGKNCIMTEYRKGYRIRGVKR